ncbi:MAG: pilus assembly protein PilM [Planctomycetes bacterium]|nr:pilus assembly protein PilM [Planctomycetota bacterium]
MAQLIGLDLGTQRVKAAVLSARRGGLRLLSLHERVLASSENQAGWVSALRPALESLHREIRPGSTPVIAVLPSQFAILRNVTAPFTRTAELDRVVKGQVEPQLPVVLEDVVVDYEAVSQQGQQSELFVAAYLKSDLREILSALASAGFEPERVTLDLFALFHAALESRSGTRLEHALVLDLGAGATHAVFVKEGRFGGGRAVRFGGHSLTLAVQKELGVSLDAAETAKMDFGTAGVAPSEKLNRVIGDFYARVAREARIFLAALGVERSVDSVLLAGGGSAMPGASDILGRELGVPVIVLDPLGRRGSASEQIGDRATAARTAAVALGGVLPETSPDLRGHNLLREEFRLRPHWETFQWAAATAAALVAALLGLLALRVRTDLSGVEADLERVRDAQRRTWASVFPDRAYPESGALRHLDARVGELEAQIQLIADSPERRSALQTLHELLGRVPANQKFILQSVTVNSTGVNLSGETDTLSAAVTIERSINDSPLFSCKLGNADSTEGRVRFQMEVALKKAMPDGRQP